MRSSLKAGGKGLISGVLLLLGALHASAAQPAITSATVVDVYYDAGDPTNGQYAYRIVATNGATTFAATGLPPDAALNGATGWINGNRSFPGLYDSTVRATNGEGTATASVRFAIHPAVTGVTSSRGAFRAGQSFTVTLHFNAAVTVVGAPRLALAIGNAGSATLKDAVYVAGSGTSDLDFRYTVMVGDDDADGVQLLPGALHDGTIADANGLTVSPTLPVKYFVSGITISTATTAGMGSTTTPTVAPLSVPVQGRLANVSARLKVADGDASRSLIAGFVIAGEAAKRVLLRAVGPALSGFGVQGALADPRLKVYSAAGGLVADNDNWSGSETVAAAALVGAFSLPDGGRDSATVATLPPGAYTLVVMANGGEGVALAEVYDLDAAEMSGGSKILNLSTRGHVEGGEGTLIAGFAVSGTSARRMLIRGVGPALTAFGVADALSDPTLKIYRDGRLVAENDNWQTGATDVASTMAAAGAFAFATGSKDAAVVLTLAPGAYTAVVSGAGNAAGTGLVEVYELPASSPVL